MQKYFVWELYVHEAHLKIVLIFLSINKSSVIEEKVSNIKRVVVPMYFFSLNNCFSNYTMTSIYTEAYFKI